METKKRYELIETQNEQFVKDNNTEKVYSQEELLAEILNKIDKIEKAVEQE